MKIPIVGSKIKVVESIWCDISKLVREGQKTNEKKIQLNRAYQFWEKAQKLPENTIFWESCVFGKFLGFFFKVVSPIELDLFSLTFCPSCISFDVCWAILQAGFQILHIWIFLQFHFCQYSRLFSKESFWSSEKYPRPILIQLFGCYQAFWICWSIPTIVTK